MRKFFVVTVEQLVITILAILLFSFLTTAQAPNKGPELTEIQKLRIQNLTQQIQLSQLRAQLAQKDFEAGRDALTALIQSLQVEGYTLNIETMVYDKIPPKEK